MAQIETTVAGYLDLSKSRIRDAQERHRILYNGRANLKQAIDRMNRALSRFDTRLDIFTWTDVNEYGIDYKIELEVNIAVKVTSMKTGILPDLLKFLLEAGYEAQKTEDYANEHGAQRSFTYHSIQNNVKTSIRITGRIIENDDTATCRKIQTGTEVKEVPTYKIECD